MSKLLPWVPKPGDYWSLPYPLGRLKIRTLKEHVEARGGAVYGSSTKGRVMIPATVEEARAMGNAVDFE